eukprot:6371439-Prorocentrum_lima.AAC.1
MPPQPYQNSRQSYDQPPELAWLPDSESIERRNPVSVCHYENTFQHCGHGITDEFAPLVSPTS